jgi:hypothetical protein
MVQTFLVLELERTLGVGSLRLLLRLVWREVEGMKRTVCV